MTEAERPDGDLKQSTEATSPSDVLPPEKGNSGDTSVDIAALVHHYTDRPDLLINALEAHDPGFVKTFNASARQHQERVRGSRHRFGKVQAYTSLGIQSIAAISILAILGFAVYSGSATFWTIIALAVFYAISQSGPGGFKKIVTAVHKAVTDHKSKTEKD